MEVAVPSRVLSCGPLGASGAGCRRRRTPSSASPAPPSCSSSISPTPPPSSAGLSARASLSSSFMAPFVGESVSGELCGQKLGIPSLNPSLSGSRRKRGVITMVVPFLRGSAWEQPPPDLASYLYKNRIVYLGMSLVPSVTELMLAEFLYLQYEDEKKPIYLYINSTGTTKVITHPQRYVTEKVGLSFASGGLERRDHGEMSQRRWTYPENVVILLSPNAAYIEGGEKLGYETEAFAIYDAMRYVKPPIFTLCVGNAWGEAALLLAAGALGNRSALPSSTIMIKEPIARFQGQATDIDLARKEVKNVKNELVKLYARHIGKTTEQIEMDIRRPKYFSPSEAVEYGIIDKVLYNQRGKEDRGVVSDLKKAQLL